MTLTVSHVENIARRAQGQLYTLQSLPSLSGTAWGTIERVIGMLNELQWECELERLVDEGIVVAIHEVEQ